MKTCRNCHVAILDNTRICPLCSSVLEIPRAGQDGQRTDGSEPEMRKADGSGPELERACGPETELPKESGSEPEHVAGMYPNVKDTARMLNFLVKLYTFLAIVAEGGLIAINYATFSGLWWSAISGIAILYFYITLRYSIQKNSGYLRVILTQIFCGVILTVGIDVIIGYRGWSVDYVAPGAILLIDLAVIILMLVNVANWQSYILLQILTVVLSVGMLILWRVGIVTVPVVTIIAAAVSAVLFVGTIIFGDRRAKNELKRRFHV